MPISLGTVLTSSPSVWETLFSIWNAGMLSLKKSILKNQLILKQSSFGIA